MRKLRLTLTIADANEFPRHRADLGEICRDIVVTATFAGDQMEAATREGLGGGCTAEMNHCGKLLLLLRVGGRIWSACKNRRDVAVQKHRRELDSVARHDASIKPIEPAVVRHDSVVPDAISSCFGEGCVGHLVHADGARSRLVNREGIRAR